MANTSWKLVVTPLNAEAETREAVVHADNWLSALRLARKALGEEGGVPPGASCVMSATGEVTILDAVQRRRYLLARSAASVPPPAAEQAAPAEPAPSPPAATPARKATIAYSPAEAAKIRAQAQALAPAAAQPPASAPKAAPSPGGAETPAPVPQTPAAAPLATPAAAPKPGAQVPAASPTPSIGSAATEPPPSAGAAVAPGAPRVSPGAAGPGQPTPARRATMAYSPDQVANARREAAASAPSEPKAPAARPDTGPLRKATVAYSPAESAAVREQIAKAQAQVNALADTVPPPAEPALAPTPGVEGAAKAATKVDPTPKQAVGTGLPAPLTGGAKPLERRSTVAYSPEESAAVRAQLTQAQAQAAAAAGTAQASLRTTTQSYSPNEVAEARAQLRAAQEAQAAAAPRKKATMAYVESPFIGGALLALGTRDQEPSGESPLTYRERTYFAPEAVERTRLEALLHGELARIQGELAGRARGQFVSLAVFDHHFQGKPERPPIATLEWKDWRGVAVFWQANSASSGPSTWAGAGEGPVRSMSFAPGALAPVAAPTAASPSPSPAPSAGLAPSAAMFTPAPVSRSASESWPVSSAREGTGEQDRRLAVAFEAVQDLYFLGSAAEGLDFAVKLLAELVPSEATSGSVYDINTDEFRVVAATGPGADARRATALPSSVGLLAAAMLSHKETFVVPDVAAEPRFDGSIDGREGIEVRNLAYLPMAKGDVWLGVVQLINRRNPRGFSDGDLAVAAYVAGQVLEFLHTKRQTAPRRR